MGAKYTEGQKTATYKYMEGRHTIRVTVPTETADRYKQEAAARGLSLTQFIIECVEKELKGAK